MFICFDYYTPQIVYIFIYIHFYVYCIEIITCKYHIHKHVIWEIILTINTSHKNYFLNMYKDCLYHLFIPIKALSRIQICHMITFHMNIYSCKYKTLNKNYQF